MTSPVMYDLDEERKRALNKDEKKEDRLFSISLLNPFYPLDSLVMDEEEDLDIRIAALDCLDLFGVTLYNIDIDSVPKELALAVIERLDDGSKLKEIALNHKDIDYRIKALENKHLTDEEALKYIIENESVSDLRSLAACHPCLNDSEFLEGLALNDDDRDVRAAAVSNYSTKDVDVLKKVISDDEDTVRIPALENLVFKFNLFYPSLNKEFNFKKKFHDMSWHMISSIDDYVPKEMDNDDGIRELIDFELLDKIYIASANECYDELIDALKIFFEKALYHYEIYNPFDESKLEKDSYRKKMYDKLKLAEGDKRSFYLYQMAYDGGHAYLNFYLDYLNDLDYDSYLKDSDSSNEESNLKKLFRESNDLYIDSSLEKESDASSLDKKIEESYFIDLAYADSNCEMVRLAIEAISDNSVLFDFAKNGKTSEIRKTAIKRLTDSSYLLDLAVNQIDKDIREANFYDDDWICDYISNNSNDYFDLFNTYEFYSHDLEHYKRLFDNRLDSFYYDKVAWNYYRNTISFCLLERIDNYLDLVYAVKNTRSFVLRDLVIYKIENPLFLTDIALNAIDERIRYTAFGRIESNAFLKYVYLNSKDFRIKLLYLSKTTDNAILEEAFLNEKNDVLRKSILDNSNFKISPKVIEHCINEESVISDYAENKFAEQFVNYMLMNKKFL